MNMYLPHSLIPHQLNLVSYVSLRPVESRGIHESGTMGEMVTYRYYVGRLNMFEDQYDLAEQNFDYALRHCHHSAVANKKRILNYLVPVKLLRGRLPTSKCEVFEFLDFLCDCFVLFLIALTQFIINSASKIFIA